MKLQVVKQLNPLYYGNEHGLPRVRATIESIRPERATKVADEARATIKGAKVAFVAGTGDDERRYTVRLERKKLIRLAHALGRIGRAPGSTADTADLVGGEVYLYVETARRDGTERIARFTAIDSPFGG